MTLYATKKNLDLYIHWASGKVTKIISRDTSCPICSVEITKDLYVITTALIKTNDFKLPYINIPVGTINELHLTKERKRKKILFVVLINSLMLKSL